MAYVCCSVVQYVCQHIHDPGMVFPEQYILIRKHFILLYFTFKIFLRSAKKAELEENQRSYKQKKKRRRIKVQEDSSSENKVIMAFVVCLNYYSPIILYFIVSSPFLFVFHSVITFYCLILTIVERMICFLFSAFSKKVFNSFLMLLYSHLKHCNIIQSLPFYANWCFACLCVCVRVVDPLELEF